MNHEHGNHTHNCVSGEETVALLKYMAHHNAQHAQELMETVSSLDGVAAELIKEAVALLNQSTEKINRAINETEG